MSWYCGKCDLELDSIQVTNDARCDICGEDVATTSEMKEEIDALTAERDQLREERDTRYHQYKESHKQRRLEGAEMDKLRERVRKLEHLRDGLMSGIEQQEHELTKAKGALGEVKDRLSVVRYLNPPPEQDDMLANTQIFIAKFLTELGEGK